MKTKLEQIKSVLDAANQLTGSEQTASVSCFACNEDGGPLDDEQILEALADGSFRLCLDIESYRCFGQEDEELRAVGIESVLGAVEKLPEVVEVEHVGDGSGSYGSLEGYEIKLKDL